MTEQAVDVTSKQAETSAASKICGCCRWIWRHLFGVLFFLTSISLTVVASWKHQACKVLLNKILRRCAKLGWFAPILIVLFAALLNILMLPTFPLMIGAGVLFQ